MFDHVTVRVADRSASERFFETVLSRLGIESNYRTNALTMWRDFIVTETSDGHPVTTGVHVAFAAPSREQVDAFWQAGVDSGYTDDGPPGERPRYGEDYYGGFLRDPDGTSVEAVHLGAVSRPAGVIDHLWIRVSDLAASTAFYRIAGNVADFAPRYEGPDRTTFGPPGEGPSFSLVPGDPTANLHVAFPGSDEAVRRFHADATAAGHPDNGEPGERARYHPGYYASFVLDPDGNNIEVVNHNFQ
jgi:catechol 2,3-dioxygenase-like lactoylglutathione lyase family enzyme